MSGLSRAGRTGRTTGCATRRHPGQAFTPNEKYAALVEAAGYVPVALRRRRLHRAAARTVAGGQRLRDQARTAAATTVEELNPLRLQRSGVREKKDLWEIHHDPYDVSRIFVRGRDGVDHRVLEAPGPGADAVRGARLGPRPPPSRRRGRTATEEQIADAVAALLRRAHDGPDEQEKPRKMTQTGPAGRRPHHSDHHLQPQPTRPEPPEAGTRSADEHATSRGGSRGPAGADTSDGDARLAKVIPLGIFDPFAEAEKRW